MSSWVDWNSMGKVLAAGLVGGVGLVVFFSLGLIGLSRRRRPRRTHQARRDDGRGALLRGGRAGRRGRLVRRPRGLTRRSRREQRVTSAVFDARLSEAGFSLVGSETGAQPLTASDERVGPMTHAAWDPERLLDRYDQVRSQTERLAAPLSPEDQTVQSMPDTSPTKWHRAHVTWFFETFVLADQEAGFAPFQDAYWFLFNSYYESVGPRYARPDRGLISRPGAHEVGAYRGNVDERMRDLVSTVDAGRWTR